MRKLLLIFLAVMVASGCEKKTPEEVYEHADEGVIHLTEESQRLIELEIAPSAKVPFRKFIEVAGEIARETEDVAHITSPEPGTLKSIVKEIGETVEKDTPLATVEARNGQAIELVSPRHGIVMAQYVKTGESVDNLTSVMTIADPDLLRASFNVYEKDIAAIKVGQNVLVESVAYPGKQFEGKLVFVSPSVDEMTRAIKIRVNVKNEEHLLKFGMFVMGKIEIAAGEDTLAVPRDAVQTIKDKAVVFAQDERDLNEFRALEVKTGRQSPDQIEILQGLEPGKRVVTKGGFYLKSEILKEELEDGHGH